MSRYVDLDTLPAIVAEPPHLDHRANDGGTVREYQTLVGWVAAPVEDGHLLTLYGIDVRFADFDPDSDRWEQCLFSPQVADMLETLCAEGQFPWAFEAVPSQGEMKWLEARAKGATERPPMEPRLYCLPATEEAIAAISEDDDRSRIRKGSPARISGDEDGRSSAEDVDRPRIRKGSPAWVLDYGNRSRPGGSEEKPARSGDWPKQQ